MSAYENWQWEAHVIPLQESINALLPSFCRRFNDLQRHFIGRDWEPPEISSNPLFFSQSEKRDAHRSARRFALGVQPKGTGIYDRKATPISDVFPRQNPMISHVNRALEAKHPAFLVEELLEPSWKFVFQHMEELLTEHGHQQTWGRLNGHRINMKKLFEDMARELEPLRQEMHSTMPASCKLISGHIHVPLFYVLLLITKYPNPDLAFRLLVGAPILGIFDSPALVSRSTVKKDRLPLSDSNMRLIARQCAEVCAKIGPTLSTKGAATSMEKIRKEISKRSLEGPYLCHEDLCIGIENEIRRHDGLEHFVLDRSLVIVGPTFTVEEIHAWQEGESAESTSVEQSFLDVEPKIRNIWNGVLPNRLTESWATYLPNTHSDVAVIALRWITVMTTLGFPFHFLAWKSDFTGAYRQMPLFILHMIASASCHWNYEEDRHEYVFYRSLPFGSSLAPAGWSEVVYALCHILAIAMFLILTHCVDDVCNMEVNETVMLARTCFLDLCGQLGFVIDMSAEKSPVPCDNLIYLGLQMVTPARIPRAVNRYLSLSITELRRQNLIRGLNGFLSRARMTPGEASSFRGKLMFYTFWFQAARSYLTEFAARQYSVNNNVSLTPDLIDAIHFFKRLLEDPAFIRGILPELIQNRQRAVIYTDGALEHDKTFKGIGGVLFRLPLRTPLYFSDVILPPSPNFTHIAPIEMHGVYRAFKEFGHLIRNRAVIFFVDNTHALGCLLKRSSSVRERGLKRDSSGTVIHDHQVPYTHFDEFCKLPLELRRIMNEQAKSIWAVIHELDVVVWFEYVKSKENIADPPSRGVKMPLPAIHISESSRLFVTSDTQ